MKARNKKGVLLPLLACLGLCTSGAVASLNATEANAEDGYYNVGSSTQQATRLQAETGDGNKNSGYTSSDRLNFVDGQVLELGFEGGYVTHTVNVETAGEYVVKMAYFTGSVNPKLSVTVNDGTAVTTDALKANGWAADGNTATYYAQVNVTLSAGENTVTVRQDHDAGGYVNLDFIEIYKSDAVYYYGVEHSLYPDVAGGFAVGERIEAEWGFNTTTNRSYAEITGNNVSGCLVYNTGAPMQYSVYAETAGKYTLQIANCANAGGTLSHKWDINGTDYTLAFDCVYNYSGDCVQTVSAFEVELQQGLNIVTLEEVTTTSDHTRIDYITFYKQATDNVDEVGQMEQYAVGEVLVLKNENTYSELEGYATEFTITERGSAIEIPVTTTEAGYYDFYVRAWSGANNAYFDMSINGGEKKAYAVQNSGWITDAHSLKDNVYRIYLEEGANTLKLTKNAAAYVDLDWFYITKEKITATPNNGDGFKVFLGENLPIADAQTTLAVDDQTLASASAGAVTGLKVGDTTVSLAYTMDNGYTLTRKYALTVVGATAEFASVSLEGELGLNFYFRISDAVIADDTAKLVFTAGGATQELTLSDGAQKDGYYVFTYKLAAKDYKTVVNAKLTWTDGECEASSSIESYADYVEAHKTEAKYEACAELVAAMKEYCEAARIYFAGESATEGFTDVTAATLEGYKATATGTLASDVTVLGATLILESETTVRVYFTATSTVVDGAVSVAGVENCYYLEVRDIAAKDLDEGYEFAIGDYTVTCSALSYAYSVVNDSESGVALKNVAKALYKYNAAADEYWNTEG